MRRIPMMGVGVVLCTLVNVALVSAEAENPPAQEKTGVLLGTVRFTGKVPPPKKLETTENSLIVHHDLIVDPKSKGLRDVVAFLENAPAQPPVKKAKPALLDQKDMIFLPRVLAVQQGQTVRFENNDQCNHSVIANSTVKANQFNLFVTHQHPYEHVFEAQKHSIQIGCSLHAWMRAYIYVFPHPWFALTDAQGQFKIEGIPPGTYTLWLRHPDTGKHERREVRIRAGEQTQVTIEWDKVEEK